MSTPDRSPVLIRVPVFWGDLDAYGHVNNTVFFRWFEEARMAYLARCGLIESYDRDRIGVILHSTSCRFRAPVFHPDTIEVAVRVGEVGQDRFTMEYTARSITRGEVVGEGSAIVVCFDYAKQQKATLPVSVRGKIHEIEKS